MSYPFNRAEALRWYVQGVDLVTIAQHYGITVETLKVLLHNARVKPC